ncbi:MAG: pyruvate kinase [Spirochaetaceae bacterium]|jgi:pyruvate kinase|nr:pyruvate kinase [Spirochaetaceae bacterium]
MKNIRYTKIICTMGPTTEDLEVVRALIRKGMNIARFNFSHGNYEYHAAGIARVRKAAELEGTTIALLLDTKGPEIRTGLVKDDKTIHLEEGSFVDVVAENDAEDLYGKEGTYTQIKDGKVHITVSYKFLADDIKPGARILIADGLFELDFVSLEGRVIHCKVDSGGDLGSRKNVNVLGVHTRLPAMADKDKKDLRFGHEQGMDFVAASFIRKARDIISIQKYLASIGSDMPVIAKIEDDEGLNNIEEIIRVSGGIMVARGDLGVQIPPPQVPIAQKHIINLCNKAGKPVITATQMLDSMIRNPRPTRAEAGDVANAVLDGTDCVMLSGETANGAYPVQAVEAMDEIARTAEASDVYQKSQNLQKKSLKAIDDTTQAVAASAVLLAEAIKAACIITPTLTGNTPRLVSKYKPRVPVLAASPVEKVRRRILLYRGVEPLTVNNEFDSEAVIQGAQSAAIKAGFAQTSDKIVFTAGIPVNTPNTANTIRYTVVGKILARGDKGNGGKCTGRIIKANTLQEASVMLRKHGGDILLTHTLDNSFVPIIRIAQGIIIEGVSEFPHEMLQKINPNIVCISEVADAMNHIEENLTVTLDGTEKIIYEGTIE